MRREPVARATDTASSVLPVPGGALQQQGLVERVGEKHRRGDIGIGEVPGGAQAAGHIVLGREPARPPSFVITAPSLVPTN